MKVEFSAFPRAFTGNVAVFVAADKQLLATAQTIDKASGGALTHALSAGRFTGGKGQTQTMLGQSGTAASLLLLGVGAPYPQRQQQYGTDGGEGDRNLDARTAKTKRDQRTWRMARPCSRAPKRNIHARGIPE